MDKVRDLAWTVDAEGELAGVRRLTPEGLYGRRKMTKLVQRTLPDASPGAVDRAMKSLGLKGIRRSKGVRTTIPGKDGRRAGDLLNRDFTAAAPNRTWVMDFTYCRTWAGFAYVAFIVDVFAQKIVAWHCATSKDVELVMTPLRMATWQREREGRAVVPGELIGHADAGSQGGLNRLSQHLTITEVFHDTTSAAGGSSFATGDAVPGSPDPRPTHRARVLAPDRARQTYRGSRARDRRVDAGGLTLVSPRWRDATAEPGRADRPLPVVLRA